MLHRGWGRVIRIRGRTGEGRNLDVLGAGDGVLGLDRHAVAPVQLRKERAVGDHHARRIEIDAKGHRETSAALERPQLLGRRRSGLHRHLYERREVDVVFERLRVRSCGVINGDQVHLVGELIGPGVVGGVDAARAFERDQGAEDFVQLGCEFLRGHKVRRQVERRSFCHLLEQLGHIVAVKAVRADVEQDLVNQSLGILARIDEVEKIRQHSVDERDVVVRERPLGRELLQRRAEPAEEAHHILRIQQVEVEEFGHVDEPRLFAERGARHGRHLRVLSGDAGFRRQVEVDGEAVQFRVVLRHLRRRGVERAEIRNNGNISRVPVVVRASQGIFQPRQHLHREIDPGV